MSKSAFDSNVVNSFPRLQRFSYRTCPATSRLGAISASPDQAPNAIGEIMRVSVAFPEILHHRYHVVRFCVHIHNLNREEIYVRGMQT